MEVALAGHPGTRHQDHILSVLKDPSAPARSAIAASWQRSLSIYGLSPDESRPPDTVTAGRLAEARQSMEGLLDAAQSPLDRLYRTVGGAGCCVLMTDRNGIAVDHRGAPEDDEVFRRWRLWPGAVWSEASEGTNGIGTCLAQGAPVAIHRDQHFHTRNIGLSCIDAPIYDHCGRLAGALDVSSARADLTEGLMGLIAAAVQDAARTIEVQAFRGAFPDARVVLAQGEPQGPALLALDRDDLVVGATRAARLAHSITDERIRGQLLASDVLPSSAAGIAFADAERGAIRRALARSNGNVSDAARSLGISRATLYRKIEKLETS